MKKVVLWLLIACCLGVSSLCSACGGNSEKPEPDDKPQQEETTDEKGYEFQPPEVKEQVPGSLDEGNGNYAMTNGAYKLEFNVNGGSYGVYVTKNGDVKFFNDTPAVVSVTTNRKLTQTETLKQGYTKLYGNGKNGITGYAALRSAAGSEFSLYDEYYTEGGNFIVKRTVICDVANESAGYTSNFSVKAKNGATDYSDCEYMLPANIYNNSSKYLGDGTSDEGFAVSDGKAPMPIAVMRIKESGDLLALSRKNPYINTLSTDQGGYSVSKEHKYGSIGFYKDENVGVKVDYPCQEAGINTLAHKFAQVSTENDIRFTVQIFAGNYEDYTDGVTEAYLAALGGQTVPETSVDLNAVYKYNIEDLPKMAYNSKDVALLPFARYIETGKGFSYYAECGYIGMQISLGYELFRYGLANNNSACKDLGLKMLNMWADTSAYPGTNSGVFRCYRNEGGYGNTAPTLRILTDGAEGMLDALRLAESNAKEVNVSNWKSMVTKYADFLVRSQNADGSWYRAYDYDGAMVVAGNRFGIPVNADTIAESKLNTQIPVRFLVRMYEYTGSAKYLAAAKKAGEYVVNEIIPNGSFSGGTLDTQGVVDRESGIFCEYAMNALYSCTKENKWLKAAESAAVYSFSWTYINDFIVHNGNGLKAGVATSKGYTAGMSVISTAGYGADSFISYMYYDLFKLYVWTGNEAYYKMADLAQNATKRIMDLNGEYGYAYRSYAIEATNIALFRFITAEETGVWLPWITNAYIEPMTNMLQTFGTFDIANVGKDLTAVKEAIFNYGAGGKTYGEIKK